MRRTMNESCLSRIGGKINIPAALVKRPNPSTRHNYSIVIPAITIVPTPKRRRALKPPRDTFDLS